jgi:GNAT superfamily N-acetyltransferase
VTKKELPGGYELDDDVGRIDRGAVLAFLATSYWAAGRTRRLNDELIDRAELVLGLYRGDDQIGYLRAVSDGHTVAYLADVYVLDGHRGAGLGLALVRFAIEESKLAGVRKWLLHTRDMHPLYRKVGFVPPGERTMERWNPSV